MLGTIFASPIVDPYTPLENHLLNAGMYVFIGAALLEFAFLVHYVIVAPAFRSAIGWMFVLRSASFLIAGVAILLGRILGPFYAARPYLTLVLFCIVLLSAGLTYGTFLFERYLRGRGGAQGIHAVQNFARRALGLKPRSSVQPCAEEQRPTTRPLRIVGGTGS